MSSLLFITSNPNKAAEVSAILQREIASQALDIPEIQSFSLEEIVRYKVEHAFKELGKPVLVEDVSFDLAVLKNFPGPFIKFWEKVGGHDVAAEIVEKLHDARAAARCGVGYFDGKEFLYLEGRIDGTFVPRRGEKGWGFDFYFVPEGEHETFSEMGPERKNLISHRRKAWEAMRALLQEKHLL